MGAVEHVAMLRARLDACEQSLEQERRLRLAAEKNARQWHALLLKEKIEKVEVRHG